MIKDGKSVKVVNNGGMFGGFYFLGFIGAAVYFMQSTTGFWDGAGALLKALVWPAFLIHQVFVALHI